MTATEEEIGARVDALAHEHQGDEFVAAMRRLADELGPDGQPVLQQVLLERAADEEDFQKAVRRRFAEKGWMRRTYARLEASWRDDRADEIAAALEAGPAGEATVEQEGERLKADRGRASLVLDELSRHASARVRAWVPGAAARILDEGGSRLILSMTRDRDDDVREAAVDALLAVDPETARTIAPDLRRQLHSSDVGRRIGAAWALAELGDRRSLAKLAEQEREAATLDERSVARAASLVLEKDEGAVISGLSGGEADEAPPLARAARLLGTPATLAALEECARSGVDDAVRAACRAELERAGAD
ncbi:MAG: HEAT repeat domain-containing protein [Gaiellaceae bacterium]